MVSSANQKSENETEYEGHSDSRHFAFESCQLQFPVRYHCPECDGHDGTLEENSRLDRFREKLEKRGDLNDGNRKPFIDRVRALPEDILQNN